MVIKDIERPRLHRNSITNIKIIDGLLLDGYPVPSTVLVLGDPGAGKTMFCVQFVYEALKRGSVAIYGTLDKFPNDIRELMFSFDWLYPFESEGRLAFLDCYSHQVRGCSDEKFVVTNYEPTSLIIEITKALSSCSTNILLVLDSISVLLQRFGKRPTFEFLRTLTAKVRYFEANCLLTLNRSAFHPRTISAIEDIVDGVVEMKVEEDYDGLLPLLRIPKMMGTRCKTAWVPYGIDLSKGLVEKRMITRPRFL